MAQALNLSVTMPIFLPFEENLIHTSELLWGNPSNHHTKATLSALHGNDFKPLRQLKHLKNTLGNYIA